ncbi:hypothetical protein ACFWYW_48780 [Nonomuraea sp. NPDC059023]|uniref:hypothetical protein n=1 Tax=unclassified Nonomuraea TaxID=2593643 RepID=UPI0036C3255F
MDIYATQRELMFPDIESATFPDVWYSDDWQGHIRFLLRTGVTHREVNAALIMLKIPTIPDAAWDRAKAETLLRIPTSPAQNAHDPWHSPESQHKIRTWADEGATLEEANVFLRYQTTLPPIPPDTWDAALTDPNP